MSIDFNLLNDVLIKASQWFDRIEAEYSESKIPEHESDCFAYHWVKTKGARPLNWDARSADEELLHIDRQAKQLSENTSQFVHGFPANNALLWGARGTGKSSLVKAVLSHHRQSQLRVLEISIRDFFQWVDIIEWIRHQPENKFIIFCDDLSFNSNDMIYREVKAALDGSLTGLPDNALIYVTSNRRHLIPEKMSDNQYASTRNAEIHHNEAIEEIISLSDRFGLWLSFHPLTQIQYLDIVEHWLRHLGIEHLQSQYREKALLWARQRGSRSGRIANQFARDYAGKHLSSKNTGIQ